MIINGNYRASNCLLGNLSVNGTAYIGDGSSQTIIDGEAVINGSLYINFALLNNLKVNGSAKIVNSNIKGTTDVNGTIKVIHSSCAGNIILNGGTLVIDSSTISNVHVKTCSFFAWLWKSIVYLNNHTQVTGDIIFEKNHGTVVLKGGSKVLGRIINGKIA